MTVFPKVIYSNCPFTDWPTCHTLSSSLPEQIPCGVSGNVTSLLHKWLSVHVVGILLLLFSHSVVSDSATTWTAACHISLSFTISWSWLKFMSNLMTKIHLSHPLSSPSTSAFNLFPASESLQWVRSSHQVAKVSELQLQHQSFLWMFRADFLWDWLVWSHCCPRDSQESSPTPQLKSINSLALSFLYDPTFTYIHDYWKNHGFD